MYFIASGGVSVYRENAEGESVSTPDTHRLEAQSAYCMLCTPVQSTVYGKGWGFVHVHCAGYVYMYVRTYVVSEDSLPLPLHTLMQGHIAGTHM